MTAILRVGMPETTGRLTASLEWGTPILVSASRLWCRRRQAFRAPGFAVADLDTALDSAGFVAQSRWGGYPWSLPAYVGLAFSYSWAWWAQMDLCCEPQVAADTAEVRRRVGESAVLLQRCRWQAWVWREQLVALALTESSPARAAFAAETARRTGPDPMPVLQGWKPEHYAESVALVDAVLGGDWPALVGVGSVCRRHLRGPDGLLSVLSRLHHELPAGVGLHLFGVKGSAWRTLQVDYPELAGRVVSTDSQAWGVSVRTDVQRERVAQTRALGREVEPGEAEWIPCSRERKEAALSAWVEAQERPGEAQAQRRLF